MQFNNILNSPPGMKSYLPQSAGEIKTIRDKIDEIFNLWGYETIFTPLLEYYDSLLTGMGEHTRKEFYKMIDYDGNILALRPEMTAPIARTVANRADNFIFPLRLSYFAPVYRYDSFQVGKYREIYQMGLEFIGKHNLADAEVIIIAIEAIKNTGIKNFKLDLGHTGYLDGIIDELDLSDAETRKFKLLLTKKDFVSIENYISNLNVKDERLLRDITALRGDLDVLDKADSLTQNDKSKQAITELRQLYSKLKEYKVSENVNFDLSLNRGLNYYTGIVFEGFTGKLGYTICGGGRYDNLLYKYGAGDIPAVGFAIGIERLRLALQKQDYRFSDYNQEGVVIYNSDQGGDLALNIARLFHEKGIKLILADEEEMDNYQQKYNKQEKGKIISLLNIEENIIVIKNIEKNEDVKIRKSKGWQKKLWKIW